METKTAGCQTEQQVLLHNMQWNYFVRITLRTDFKHSGGVAPPPRGIDSWIKNNVEDTNGLTMHVCEFEGQQKVDLDVIGHGIMGEKESECMWTVSERDPGLLYVHK